MESGTGTLRRYDTQTDVDDGPKRAMSTSVKSTIVALICSRYFVRGTNRVQFCPFGNPLA